MGNQQKGKQKKRPMARLIVDPAVKKRLEALIQEDAESDGALDRLLERMIDIYEERMACPRGAIR